MNKKYLFFILVFIYGLQTQAQRTVEKVEHRWSSLGLEKIQADGTYVYKVEVGGRSQSTNFRIAEIPVPHIVSEDGKTDFESMYKIKSLPYVELNYEYMPFTSFGKLGLSFGLGMFTANGRGHFSDETESEEAYNLYGIPLSGGLVYRFEFSSKQLIAPYVTGGVSYIAIAEMRDDNQKNNYVGAAAAYGAGGILVSITAWDRDTALLLDGEYGITNLWLNIEGRAVSGLKPNLDFTGSYVSFGMTLDF